MTATTDPNTVYLDIVYRTTVYNNTIYNTTASGDILYQYYYIPQSELAVKGFLRPGLRTLLTPTEVDQVFGTNFIFLKKEDLSTAAANESPIVRQDSDPDGPPIGLPIRVQIPNRYEILGYTPAKFGEHPGGSR